MLSIYISHILSEALTLTTSMILFCDYNIVLHRIYNKYKIYVWAQICQVGNDKYEIEIRL